MPSKINNQMAQEYIEYQFEIAPLQPISEILVAQLAEVGFESFVETDDGVLAYIQKEFWDDGILNNIQILKSPEANITFQIKEIAQVNWNAEWEKNFSPISVEDQCVVRAPFHDAVNVSYEIVIEPKMSFGTGHHETTYMMLQYLLAHRFDGQQVLDMGCGTAVLAILAAKRGAESVTAIDIDTWCVENSEENIARNGKHYIEVQLGDATILPQKPTYHTIIANINRNILLADLKTYKMSLQKEGTLFLSGFYAEDLDAITDACTKLGLQFVDSKERNRWIAAKFVNLN
jgi:ribosomal protein L11 methyltransferase